MAACTNNGGSRARRAVTAALVGVLSVGAVPMAAVAQGVADGIAPLFAEGTEVTNGTATLSFKGFDEATGDYVNINDTTNVDGIQTVDTDKMPVVPSITELYIAGSNDCVPINNTNIKDYKVRVYKADENGDPTGTPLSGNKAVDAGEYVVTVTALSGTPYEGQTFKTNFIVKGLEFPPVLTAYEDGNPADMTFTYTGSPLDVDFKKDDTAPYTRYVEGVDYTVTYKLGNKEVDSVVDAGKYTATIKGLGKYAGSTAVATVTVGQFDLDAATITVDDFTSENIPTSPSSITWHGAELDPSLVGLTPVGTISTASATPCQFDVTVSQDVLNEGNIKFSGSRQVTDGCLVDALCDFKYNGSALLDSYELDQSKGEAFNTSAITAAYGANQATIDNITVTKKGNTVQNGSAEADLNAGEWGSYKVTVTVNVTTDAKGNVYGGSKTFTVKIYKGSIDADASLYVFPPVSEGYPRKAITSYAKGYDGEVLDADYFDIFGKVGSTSVTPASGDLSVKLVDANGNKITSAVDAGEYKLVVTSDWYKLSGTTELPITIGKVDLTTLEIGALVKWNNVAGEEYVPCDSRAVNPTDTAISSLELSYDTGNPADSDASSLVDRDDFKGLDWIPSNADVVVEYNDEGTWKEVGNLVDPGEYRVTVSVAEDVASNYVLPEGETSVTLNFTVAQRGTFSDVQPSDWCYSAVENANYLGYMTGYGTSGMFGPNDIINRGQAVSVLYKMSGANAYSNPDSMGMYVEGQGWLTGFDDVDPEMYYAEAIAWAKATGVVNGYTEDTFGPEDEITREQFAGMLSNYAKVVNRDETVGTADVEAVLAEFPDGAQVSDWAAEAVAWAASATDDRGAVMGNNGTLMPGNTISRAEVAAMAVNYQPINKNNVSAIF